MPRRTDTARRTKAEQSAAITGGNRLAVRSLQLDGADLVVLSRRDFDALLAAAGDEAAEMRAAEFIIRDTLTAIARGDETVLPDWLTEQILNGDTVIRAARRHHGLTQK